MLQAVFQPETWAGQPLGAAGSLAIKLGAGPLGKAEPEGDRLVKKVWQAWPFRLPSHAHAETHPAASAQTQL